MWLASENRQLIGESTLVGRSCFAAGDIGGEAWILVENARGFQPLQHVNHHEVARTEGTVEPVGAAKPGGKLLQPAADAIHDQMQALLGPRLIALYKLGVCEFKDWRLHRAERGKHPCDRAGPGIRICRKKPCVALRDMEDYRPCLEEG